MELVKLRCSTWAHELSLKLCQVKCKPRLKITFNYKQELILQWRIFPQLLIERCFYIWIILTQTWPNTAKKSNSKLLIGFILTVLRQGVHLQDVCSYDDGRWFWVLGMLEVGNRNGTRKNRKLVIITWMRWYVSDIIAISRLISTITETSI